MPTTPTPIPASKTTPLTIIESTSKYLLTHEKLIIIILVLAAICWGISKGYDLYDKHDQRQETALQQQLDASKAQLATSNQQIATIQAAATQAQQAAAQDKATATAVITAVTAQNAALVKAMNARQQATQQQQQVDLSASIPDLAKRFVTLVPGINPTDIKVAPDEQTVTIGKDTAEKTTAQLELVSQLQQDKKDLQTEVDNGQKEVGSLQKALDSESKVVDIQTQLIAAKDVNIALLTKIGTQSDAVCDARIKVEKDNTRHALWKGGKWGTVVGAVVTTLAYVAVHFH